jgi:hypothetical protein
MSFSGEAPVPTVEKTGYLRKKGDLRYFVLKSEAKPSLHWYKEPTAKERGRIEDLSRYQVYTFGSPNSPTTVVFKLVPPPGGPTREYVLQASSNFEVLFFWI